MLESGAFLAIRPPTPQRHGTPLMHDPVTIERFWRKVEKRGPDECWPWKGALWDKGYGQFRVDGRKLMAHRVSLILAGRPQPSDKPQGCHTCDNPPCVNPAHLWWGTNGDNQRDCVAKGRHPLASKTHCLRGHPLSGENLIRNKRQRECRTCRQMREVGRWDRRRAAVSSEDPRP